MPEGFYTGYGLILTKGVHGATEVPVWASEDFGHFRNHLKFGQAQDPGLKQYRKHLLDAIAGGSRQPEAVTGQLYGVERPLGARRRVMATT